MIDDRTTSLRAYVPGSFSGTITLFQASSVSEEYARFFDHRPQEEQRTLGWCAFSPRPVDVVMVPGTHNLIGSEPNVGVLAARMREALAAARARAAAEAAR